MRKTLAAMALLPIIIGGIAGPATALNVTRSGGGHCTHWVISTNNLGWPTYKCVSYYYNR